MLLMRQVFHMNLAVTWHDLEDCLLQVLACWLVLEKIRSGIRWPSRACLTCKTARRFPNLTICTDDSRDARWICVQMCVTMIGLPVGTYLFFKSAKQAGEKTALVRDL